MSARASGFRFALVCAGLLSAASPALAHRPSDSYLQLAADHTRTSFDGHWDIALRDLDYALELDDGDGALTWGELRGKEADARAYASSALQLAAHGKPCATELGALSIVTHSDGSYARFPVAVECPIAATSLEPAYGLMRGLDPQHRGILRVTDGKATHDTILSANAPAEAITLRGEGHSLFSVLSERVAEGFAHILSGADHVLFLVALLLGTMLVREQWRSATPPVLRRVLLDLAKIVTAFTVAHSLTLALGALGLVSVSARIIEPAIAASVALAALANLFPLFGHDRWVVPFALGLLHGFGFSSGLTDAGLSGSDLWLSLLGFNLGVEFGQLAIVALFVPIAMAVRSHALHRKLVLYGGSLATLVAALVWFIERLEMG